MIRRGCVVEDFTEPTGEYVTIKDTLTLENRIMILHSIRSHNLILYKAIGIENAEEIADGIYNKLLEKIKDE